MLKQLDPKLCLYVLDPIVSAKFYQQVFGCPPVESSPNFVMFSLPNGGVLGLWAKHDVKPKIAAVDGMGGELLFSVSDKDTVETMYAEWKNQGFTIAQEPEHMDFGYTFVALDPDGHRLRVYVCSTQV